MYNKKMAEDETVKIPVSLKPFFWDVDFASLSWEGHHDFITRRVLQKGDWNSICWLRSVLTDQGLRLWLEEHKGGGLDTRPLRFWETVLEMDRRKTRHWIKKSKNSVWGRRMQR